MTVVFTTSWDDGHPLDLRLAEVLARHGIRGTFYAPRRNIEGRAVMSTTELRELAQGFEIGGHTLEHVRLDAIGLHQARSQVLDGKARIEDELGAPIIGFCYPGGTHNASIREIVRSAGFRYARTTDNFHAAPPHDPFRTPTTLQLFPHDHTTYLKNFIRGRQWGARRSLFKMSLTAETLDQLLARLLAAVAADGGVFHLWGHSWEIEERQLWTVLDRFLARVAAFIAPAGRVDNQSVYATH